MNDQPSSLLTEALVGSIPEVDENAVMASWASHRSHKQDGPPPPSPGGGIEAKPVAASAGAGDESSSNDVDNENDEPQGRQSEVTMDLSRIRRVDSDIADNLQVLVGARRDSARATTQSGPECSRHRARGVRAARSDP